MTNAKRQIHSLIRRDGMKCHYCKEETVLAGNARNGASRDHVIPKVLGGTDTLSNFVLACRDCNSKRGHALFSCDCSFCQNVYDLWTLREVQRMYNYERIRVKKARNGKWKVTSAGNTRTFQSWGEAMAMASMLGKVNA